MGESSVSLDYQLNARCDVDKCDFFQTESSHVPHPYSGDGHVSRKAEKKLNMLVAELIITFVEIKFSS